MRKRGKGKIERRWNRANRRSRLRKMRLDVNKGDATKAGAVSVVKLSPKFPKTQGRHSKEAGFVRAKRKFWT